MLDNQFLTEYAEKLIAGNSQLSIFAELWTILLKLVTTGVTGINNNAKIAYRAWKKEPENNELFTSFVAALSANKTGYVQHVNDAERISRRATKTPEDKEKLFFEILNSGIARSDIAELNKYSADNEISAEYVQEYLKERKNKSRRGGGWKRSFNAPEGTPEFDI